jgi:hypothetical protein
MRKPAEEEEISRSADRAIAESAPGALTALDDWGVDDLIALDQETAVAVLFESRGRQLRGDVPLERLLTASAIGRGREALAVVPVASKAAAPEPAEQPDGFDGLLLGESSCPASLVLATASGAAVRLRTEDAVNRPARGLDPSVVAWHVSGRIDPGDPVAPEAGRVLGCLIMRALAHELCAVTDHLLRRAVCHASERIQFGQPLVALQVVRHKLVDVHVMATAARAVLSSSWLAPEDWLLACAAKVSAGSAFMSSARHVQQICGGLGFTDEFGIHQYIRRGYVLDSLLLGSCGGEREVGAALASRHQVSPVPLTVLVGQGRRRREEGHDRPGRC